MLFAFAFCGLFVAAVIGVGILADRLYPFASVVLGAVILGAAFALMLGGDQ